MAQDTPTLEFSQGQPEQHLTRTPRNVMELMAIALENKAAIDIIERLAALEEKSQARDAEQQFNEAMEAAQNEISEVIPDLTNETTNTKYASFKALNRAIRPVYLKHGFTLSFNGGESSKPEEILVLCDCSHKGGHTKKYLIPMPNDGKGAKGGGVMSKSHATLAATSYGRSCLLKLIFNIGIGEAPANGDLAEKLEWLENAKDTKELNQLFARVWDMFEDFPDALKALIAAKRKRKKELE